MPSDRPQRSRRRSAAAVETHRGRRRRVVGYLLIFVTIALLVDGLAGQRGLLETMKARRQAEALEQRLSILKQQNAGLAERVQRLRGDPATIERLARERLGYIKPGELLFILKDVEPPPPTPGPR